MGKLAVDPLVQANPAQELKIFEILDCDTGEFVDTRTFIRGFRYGEIFEPRHEIRQRWKTPSPKYVCSDCLVPVSLLAGVERNWFFFRHLFEDGKCAAKTRGDLNQKQINAIRYSCLVESEPHKRFKQLMYDCLLADDSFSDVQIEKVRTSTTTKGERRKPDTSAIRASLLHAFEVQLSSTFFDVVLERQSFYRDEGAILVWVLPNFDPDDRTMMEDDIFFHNNCNILVLNNEVALLSISEKRLHFGCWYRIPHSDGATYQESWKYDVVPFEALTVDIEKQRVFFYDYEAQKSATKAVLATLKEEEQRLRVEVRNQERLHDLRLRFEEFWLEHARGKDGTKAAWDELINSNCGAYDEFELPQEPFDDDELCALLNALYSAKQLRKVGWKFEDIVKTGHHVFDKHQRYFALFCHCLWQYKNLEAIKELDKTGKLQTKIRLVRKTPLNERRQFQLDNRHAKLIELLFPEPFRHFLEWLNSSE
jgi:hypothetical protein